MKDTWLNHNTDKILLFALTVLLLFFAGHILHHDGDNMQAFEFITGAFSTVLGALVMILTGRIQRANDTTSTQTQIVPPPFPVEPKP